MNIRRASRRSAVAALIATLLLSTIGVLTVAANATPQALPFAQNWSNTGLITADDDWSGVPGIVGYRGDNLTASAGTDPQTVLVDNLVVDINANQTDPDTFTTGGVAEFQIADPVVALQGSGTADAPYVTLYINTTGLTNINVAYNLRDVDGSADDAVQPVALQYRIGTSGPYTNLPAAFVADATTGPSLATLVTPVSITLPAAANNQPSVNLRVITTDAVGSDEWVGIDDIAVTGTPIIGDAAPAVESTIPANDATGVAVDADVSVTFSEPVDVDSDSFTIECDSSGVHTAAVSGTEIVTLDPDVNFDFSETCNVTVLAAKVSDQDTNDPPDAMSTDTHVSFTTAAPPDDPPSVVATTPADGATNVALDADLSVTFDEPVDVSGGWYDIKCPSGSHTATVTGGPLTYTLDPTADFANDESCTFTVFRQNVTDQDTNDPPDIMDVDHVVSFQMVAAPPTVDAGGPYAVVEGGSVIVSATGAEPGGGTLTYSWDLDHDGIFETLGQSATISAAGLEAPLTRTISVQATGPTGQTATDDATVDVTWAFTGFAGINDLPAVNEDGPGKLTLTFSLAGDQGLDIFRDGQPTSTSFDCGTTPPTVGSDSALAQGGRGFTYDARSNAYSFDWKVDKAAWRNTCRVFVLGLADGSTHNVAFHFR